LDRTVPGMGSGHGAAALVPWVPPPHKRLPWHTPLGPWQHPPFFFRKPNPTQGRHGWGRMADGKYGKVRGNKAKTMSGRKHRHRDLTVVRFVPFVGDEDGRKGIVTG
jgi:hypothetical protein